MKEWTTPHGRVELRSGTYIAIDRDGNVVGWHGELEEAMRYISHDRAVPASGRRKFVYQKRSAESVLKRLRYAGYKSGKGRRLTTM